MNHPAIKHRPYAGETASRLKDFLIPTAAVVVVIALLLTATDYLAPNQLFMIGVVFSLGAFGLFGNVFTAAHHKQSWRALSLRTQLECHIGSPLLGSPVYLTGTYRGRPVNLSHSSQVNYRVLATYLELTVENPGDAALRLRGPRSRQEVITDDNTIKDVFTCAGLRTVGDAPQFLIAGSPIHVTTSLLASDSLRTRLEALWQPVSIELRGQKLCLQHPGLVYDADYMCEMLDLLSELANMIEQRSGVWRRWVRQ